MSVINRNLSDLKIGTEEIKKFLENDICSSIKAAIDDLNEIIRHLKYIEGNSERKGQTLYKLSNIQSTARKYSSFSQREIEQVKNETSNDDKSDSINKYLKDITDTLMQYRILVGVYCQSKLLEIYLNNIRDSGRRTSSGHLGGSILSHRCCMFKGFERTTPLFCLQNMAFL